MVIFATFVGFAYFRVARKHPEHGNLLKRGIEAVYSIVMAIVTFVLRLTPYGILAIMASTLATSDFSTIWTLGKFLIASYAALITMCIIHVIILSVLGINPFKYVKKTLEILIFAFTSRSSAGSLPLNVQTQTQRLGVPEGIANFSATFGLSIGQNGCAGIYPAMLATMVAPVQLHMYIKVAYCNCTNKFEEVIIHENTINSYFGTCNWDKWVSNNWRCRCKYA